jgi:hypothetical protein
MPLKKKLNQGKCAKINKSESFRVNVHCGQQKLRGAECCISNPELSELSY